ncbi:hypothetical protein Dsin_011409 [Dipteronia sinensis]|uniref:HTH La-type RNA-binding domain-containing protein n=1 Tax=Dipteronia sinensis TaxID=43782 RepID=A0AAE0AVM1_9ROSI|nr:hypothetical protein Dsin_011409 [Dipteronia sinensis]
MAATSNPEIALTTPPPPMIVPVSSGVSVSSPNQSRRVGAKVAVSSPWTQIVRGESEPVASVPLLSSSTAMAMAQPQQSTGVIDKQTAATEEEEGAEYGSGNAGKRPAWNKPSNGAGTGAAAAEAGPVMGAHLWPALSETTTRGGSSTKSSSDSLKGLADGSSTPPPVVSQSTGTANSVSQRQVSNNGNPNSTTTPNHTAAPTRPRSTRRNAAGTSSNGGLPQPPSPQGPVVEMPNNPAPHSQKSGFGSQSHSGNNDHSQHRNSYKNRNGGTHHPRGDGSHHHNYGGKRDQDRGNQDWHSHRNFNGRDAPMQPQRAVQRFIRHPPPPPPPGSTPFIPPGPLRPFVNPIGFPEYGAALYYVAPPIPDPLRGVPFIGPSSPHALYFHAPDPQLHSRIVNQIDYYFSNENLIKDTYLRQNMDEQGWVPIKLIAGFNKVSLLTDNIPLILDALRSSTVVEVQGDKIRRRNDWMRWLMPHINAQAGTISRSSSGDLNNNQLQRSSSVGTGHVIVQGGSDLSAKITN